MLSQTKPLFSVVICAHNSRPKYLHEVLQELVLQDIDRTLFEIIAIDNASEPPLIQRMDGRFFTEIRLVEEPLIGLTNARKRGVMESKGDYLVFIDDDNVPSRNYLSECMRITQEYPHLGVFGSASITPRYEIQVPDWLQPYESFLAIRNEEKSLYGNIQDTRLLPCGAGLVIRRQVALTHFRRIEGTADRMRLDRRGSSLSSAGDTDLALSAIDQGYTSGVFPSLKLEHIIPKERMNRKYFERLAQSISYSLTLLFGMRNRDRPSSGHISIQVIRIVLRRLFGRPDRRIEYELALGRFMALLKLRNSKK